MMLTTLGNFRFYPVFPEGYGSLDPTGVSPISYLDSIMNGK